MAEIECTYNEQIHILIILIDLIFMLQQGINIQDQECSIYYLLETVNSTMHQKNYNIVGFLKKNSFFDDRPERSLAASLSKQSRSKQKYKNNDFNYSNQLSKQQIQQKINQKREMLFKSRDQRWKQTKQQRQASIKKSTAYLNNRQPALEHQSHRFNHFKRSVDRMQQAYFPSSPQPTQKKQFNRQHRQVYQGISRKRFTASKRQSQECLAELSKLVQNQIRSLDIKITNFNQIMQSKVQTHIQALRKVVIKAIEDIFRQGIRQMKSDFYKHSQSLKQNLILVKVKLLECQQRITDMQKQLHYNWKRVTAELLSEKLQSKIQNLVRKNQSLQLQNFVNVGGPTEQSCYNLKQIVHTMIGQSLRLPLCKLLQVQERYI